MCHSYPNEILSLGIFYENVWTLVRLRTMNRGQLNGGVHGDAGVSELFPTHSKWNANVVGGNPVSASFSEFYSNYLWVCRLFPSLSSCSLWQSFILWNTNKDDASQTHRHTLLFAGAILSYICSAALWSALSTPLMLSDKVRWTVKRSVLMKKHDHWNSKYFY